jgi:hypothetical protein
VTNSVFSLGNPTRPADTAAEAPMGRQPHSVPLGAYTGAPPRTRLLQIPVTPLVNALGIPQQPTVIVPETRGNRFVTLLAPINNFSILINGDPSFNPTSSLVLPAGIPYEITLPGNQKLYAATTAPTFQLLQVQIADAIASDTERRL